MLRPIAAVSIAFAVAACQEVSPQATAAAKAKSDRFAYTLAAKQLISERLRDPKSAEFSDIGVRLPTATTEAVICGRVNARNGFGGMTGPMRFITSGSVLIESPDTSQLMDVAWARLC